MLLPKIKIGSKAWRDARLQGIGASEVSALFPMDRPAYAMSAYTLRLVKRREIDANSVFSGDPELAAMGLHLEPAIAKIIAAKCGLKIKKGGYVVDDKEPLMRCSTDYIIEEPNEWVQQQFGRKVKGPGVFQIKSVIIHQWRREWTQHTAPEYVRFQVRQEMACLGYEWGLIGAGIDGMEYRPYPILADKKDGDEIRSMIRRFWTKCVEGDHIPPIDATESTRLALRAEFPANGFRPDSVDRRHDEELDEAALFFDTATINRQRADEDYRLAVNQITKLMGSTLHAFTANWFIDQSVSEKRRAIRVKRRTSQQEPSR